MTDSRIEEVIRQLVLANADGEINSIAVVFVNKQGEPEMEIGMNHFDAYKIISGLEILKINIISELVMKGARKPKERE